ncbi:ABC transporter permease subunit [Halomonas sp. KAO]|uniref:ABC transporter permease subunit n=1 Tax=unclassified Halomonas TaxID=2609666 RepID=UPI0018A10578|nr:MULTISPECIES: ABC transporter permease subunit [unclassified Halomonas]MBF7053629.1 ABC transporter permease subunit [Halomonas sp. KAO]MDT0500908.1 ABC transporter permease subunit [Halomonas sp. PAR7]MDT0593157.1 ABC transporter permease subunit [Halomonas sp. PAR8]
MIDSRPPPSLHLRRRRLRDRLATLLITAGGIGVLVSVLAIGVFLALEVIPLFLGADAIDTDALWRPQPVEGAVEPRHRWRPEPLGEASPAHYGMLPLAWGTLKAALWALLFAVPLALGAAVHSALYMPRRLRARLKPTLELMEAMPGVVVGFVAGLLLAPWVERHLIATLLLVITLPLGVLLAGGARGLLPAPLGRQLPLGWAGVWLMPWLLMVGAITLCLAPWLEAALVGGDLRGWLAATLGLDYAARNAMIVGVAMGFAVIPGIYALAEDALNGVPDSLAEGAQALGATRWQTLWRVVLPAASPGILSAVMIGAGRAVGETMIVLMASGNTALMTLSPLEGLRSLSATIAIELPEAAVGGTHYRLLFLAALVLFLFTFLVNTLAEVMRTRLRRRYRRREGGA